MRKIYILVFTLLVSSYASAGEVSATGEVGKIQYFSTANTLTTTWQGGLWFQIIEPDNNICVDNLVSIDPDNDIAISILLAAKMAGNSISVTVDESVKYPHVGVGFCKLQNLTIN